MSDKSVAPQKKELHRAAPWLLAVVLIGSALFIETLLTLIIPMLPMPLSKSAYGILDASLLSILLFPGLYFLLIRPLRMSVEERRRAEATLEQSVSLLRATLDSTAEGILTVDKAGRMVSFNDRFTQMWGIPRSIAQTGDSERALTHVLDQLSDPDSFIAKVRNLYSHPEMDSLDVIEFKDGRVFECYSMPQRMKGSIVGRVWSFRDVTERKRALEALATKARALSATLENMSQGISVMDGDLRMLAWNDRLLQLLDFPPELFNEGVMLEDLFRFNALRGEYGPGDPEELVRVRMELARGFVPHVFERVRANGTVLEIRGNPIPGGGFVTTYTDVTERKRSEQALRDSVKELRVFTDNVPTMTVSYDAQLRCRFANRRYAEFFGFAVDSVVGRHLREVVGEDAYREIEVHFARVLEGHPVTYHRTHTLANGDSSYLEVNLLPHSDEHGHTLGLFAVTTDITEHRLAEERAQRIAHHDALTSLPNRLLFNDRLQQAINLAKRDSRQFALLCLDLDRFKQVNDTLGHAAGDELLQAVAARMQREVRESDTLARLGGDEFAVILPDIARCEEAGTVAGKIVAAIAAPFHIGSKNQRADIGASIGIAIYPGDGGDSDALASAADTAMYQAKHMGSSFRFFEA